MSDTNRPAKPIGELNGPWARLFKVSQLMIPILGLCVVPWATWTTNAINSMNGRVALLEQWQKSSPSDAEALRIRIKSEINQEMGDKIFARFDSLIGEIAALKTSIVRLETQMTAMQRQLERKVAESPVPPKYEYDGKAIITREHPLFTPNADVLTTLPLNVYSVPVPNSPITGHVPGVLATLQNEKQSNALGD